MKITAAQSYPADPTAVHAMLTDEAFLARAASELGAVEHKVAATPSRSALEAALPAPSEIRRFIGDTLRIVMDTTWSDAAAGGSRDGVLTLTVPGAPMKAVADVRIAPAASGSTVTYDGDLTVSIPLVGGQIEKLAAPEILGALAAQERVGQAWLADR
ncbi:DUF2505 domain-containing protein [Propioniciclava sp.]|uniref:DUF2505 domain-containing protein n=1 Tax=Propioniciclava sp. TaxID=2038686 RepID=UPI00262E8A6C|nr:DUF2505 domain-containing protein [Propioniciclava sp.]